MKEDSADNGGEGEAPEEEATPKSKAMTDEAMMNIICDDIATETTAAALRGRPHHQNQ